jgi:putative MATE family efflux protein
MKEYTEKLGYAPLGRLLVSLSLPSIAAMVTTSLYNIVDTFWVARLGHEAIAALTITFPYQILFIAIGVGTGVGIGALVSRRFGERNIEATNQAAGQIFLLSVFWGAIFIVVAVFFSKSLLTAFGATPDIMRYSTQYLVIISYGAPQLIFTIVASSLIRGSGDAVKPMIIMIAASVLNIILDPFLIIGIGPFPELGISGAALATIIAQSFGALLTLYYFIARKTAFSIRVSNLRPNISILRDIYRVGAPSTILDITESLAFVLFNNVVSTYGSRAIAAVGLVLRISDLSFMPIIGVSQGLLPIVGFNFGAQNFKRLWGSVKLASVGIAVFLTMATICIEILAPQIVGIFSKDLDLLAVTIPAMRIMLFTMPLIGPNIMFITTFQGLSKGTMALILSLVRQFILFVPLLFILSHILGMHGVWWSMPASDSLAFIITFTFIYREYLKQKRGGNSLSSSENLPSLT